MGQSSQPPSPISNQVLAVASLDPCKYIFPSFGPTSKKVREQIFGSGRPADRRAAAAGTFKEANPWGPEQVGSKSSSLRPQRRTFDSTSMFTSPRHAQRSSVLAASAQARPGRNRRQGGVTARRQNLIKSWQQRRWAPASIYSQGLVQLQKKYASRFSD